MEYPTTGDDQTESYSDVVETLTSMFGNVVSREVIIAVVESCDGDLNLAAEAVMNMSSDIADSATTETSRTKESTPLLNISELSISSLPPNLNTIVPVNHPESTTQSAMSYAGASRSTGAVPKQRPQPMTSSQKAVVWTDQLRLIMAYHNQGSRTLLLMRGAPGSGKSYLAKQIVEMLVGASYNDINTHIYSTDDFFYFRGQFNYDKSRLSEAHDWNHKRVENALRQGISPVIIDNTNIEIWEMEPYTREAVKNGYIIEVVEPNTPWAKKVNQLLRKNTHNVPMATIKRMVSNYQDGITGENLLKYYGLLYPQSKVPPVIRNKPKYIPSQSNSQPITQGVSLNNVADKDAEKVVPTINESNISSQSNIADKNTAKAQVPPINESNIISMKSNSSETTERIIPIEIETEEEELARRSRYLEIQKQLDEMEKVEKEWEHGEGWGNESPKSVPVGNNMPLVLEPRPPRISEEPAEYRRTPETEQSSEKLFKAVEKCEDWRKVTLFLPSWTDEPPPAEDESIEYPVRETQSTGTCVEVGDTNLENPCKILKVISACPRDINIFTISIQTEKIPVVRMLDKSTMTNEFLITEAYRCKNEEEHFVAFRKLFKNIPRASLRDIFDKCFGDVNWAVDIVLGGMATNQIELVAEEDISDTEEETIKSEQCNCLAAYQIIPDTEIKPTKPMVDQRDIPSYPNSNEINPLPQKKPKITPTNSTLQLKREIEKNIVIGDEYYSEHALKLRNFRRGGQFNVPTQNIEDVPQIVTESSSSNVVKEDTQQTMDEAAALSDDDISNTSSLDEVERTINIHMGFDFIAQLDSLFGRCGMVYPENVRPRINIPISLLNEINAFWMESLMTQLDDQQKEMEKMIKEDEDFARQLEIKEAELAQQGKEPEIPDFKEIMDMDFAISLYQKDVAEWKSKAPTDIAAKLTRDKLYNLFPDMSPEVLSELLMAHDNNFQATVEVLLMSTGKSNILEEKNGLNKFVMEKEMERQERLLEEEKKALSEAEWPLVTKGESVDLSVVDNYREQADRHLMRRNLNYQKAQDYIRRGMTQVANHYSEMATFHKQKFEQANSLAAASLIQVHASNNSDNATIDLHFLRVGEAKETLDLFLDSHIQKLKESGNKGVRHTTLFFITGRGKHSQGGPRVKPAVKRRLRERELAFSERNPGLLTAKVCAEDKLSYQVKLP